MHASARVPLEHLRFETLFEARAVSLINALLAGVLTVSNETIASDRRSRLRVIRARRFLRQRHDRRHRRLRERAVEPFECTHKTTNSSNTSVTVSPSGDDGIRVNEFLGDSSLPASLSW